MGRVFFFIGAMNQLNEPSFWKMSKVKLRHSQIVGFNVLFFFVVPLDLSFFFSLIDIGKPDVFFFINILSVEQFPTQKQLFFTFFLKGNKRPWLGALSEVKYWQRKKPRVWFLQKRKKISKEKVKVKRFFFLI